MNNTLLLLLITDILLSLIFHIAIREIRLVIYIPLNCVHIVLWFKLHKWINTYSTDVHLKTSIRILKYLLCISSIYMLGLLINIKYKYALYMGSLVIMVIDIVRVFLYETVDSSLQTRVVHGIFVDILSLEPYLNTQKYINNRQLTLQEFYEKGNPTRVDSEYLFELWNDEAVQTRRLNLSVLTDEDKYLCPEAEEISNEARLFNKKALKKKKFNSKLSIYRKRKQVGDKLQVDLDNLVKPETYLFKSAKVNREIQKSNTSTCDEDEVVSDDENESVELLNEVQRKDHEANLWISINEEVRKAQQRQPKSGCITKDSLKIQFGDSAENVYNILTFNRSDELNYTVFRDNIRQINNERENLYTTIICNKNLLSQIYYTLIGIESLFIYWIISNWLDLQPLLIKLCIPIFVLPAFTSIKVILESFLFIVYSHPYDPGDRITMDEENYIVRDISLLTTTLIRWDGLKCIIANIHIKDKSVTNIRRSGPQTWKVETFIRAKTSDHKLNELKMIFRRLKIEDKAYKDIKMYITEILDSSYILLTVLIKHNYNFQNGFLMWNNHTKFLRILSSAFSTIGIKYLPIKQDVILQDVSDI